MPYEDSNTRWESLAAGALSGSLTSLILQPFDVIKTRQQQPNPEFYRASLVYRHIRQTEGWRGLFRGSLPALLRVAPGAGLYFWALETMQQNYKRVAEKSGGLLDEQAESPPALYNAFSSGFCRFFSVVIFAPLLFVKTRIESSIDTNLNQSRGRMWRVVKYTFQKEGFKGFFTGLTPAILRDLPFSVVYFVMYTYFLEMCGFRHPLRVQETREEIHFGDSETTEEKLAAIRSYNRKVDDIIEDDNCSGPIGMEAVKDLPEIDETIRPYANFLIASAAGILASFMTHPFDVLRTQMQLWSYKPEGSQLMIISKTPELLTEVEKITKLPRGIGSNRILIEASTALPTIATQPNKSRVHIPPAPPTPPKATSTGAQNVMDATKNPRINLYRFGYNLLKTEGYHVFGRGLMIRCARRTFATALAWTAFEELNQKFLKGFSESATHDPTNIKRGD